MTEGSDLQLEFRVSCRPPPTAFTWYRNGTTIATEQNLTLRTITRQDSGTYRWVEEGGEGIDPLAAASTGHWTVYNNGAIYIMFIFFSPQVL